MRPDKAVVRKAIEDTRGNLSRAAARLGCSRTTLYCWVYQLDHFSTWYRCLSVDLPGYGRSATAQPGLTIADMAAMGVRCGQLGIGGEIAITPEFIEGIKADVARYHFHLITVLGLPDEALFCERLELFERFEPLNMPSPLT